MSLLCSSIYPQPQGKVFTPKPRVSQQKNLCIYQQQASWLLASRPNLQGNSDSQKRGTVTQLLNGSLPSFSTTLSCASIWPLDIPCPSECYFQYLPLLTLDVFPANNPALISQRVDREVCQAAITELPSSKWSCLHNHGEKSSLCSILSGF